MSDRTSRDFDVSTGEFTPGISHQIKPEEHRSIITAIANSPCDRGEISFLPKVVVWEPPTPSVVDELRKHITNHDRIRPFEPLAPRPTHITGRYDPSVDEYWKSFKEAIEQPKHSSLIDAIRSARLEPGYHFVVDPNTGKIVVRKDRFTLEYRPDLDGYNDGRPQYHLDPNTGNIVQRSQIGTLEKREYLGGGGREGHHYGLNRETGAIELKPNVLTMDFRSK